MIISYAKKLYSKNPYNYNAPKKMDFENSNSDVLIVSNSWDDYSSKTTCFLFYLENDKVVNIGGLRLAILSHSNTHKYFEENFEEYEYINIIENNIDFYSLGQDIVYYEKIKKIFDIDSRILLNSLRDVAISNILNQNPSIVKDLNYYDSILRTSISKTLLNKASQIIDNQYLNFNFSIDYKVPTFNNRHQLNFIFNDEKFELNNTKINNINLLIGENGVGKSQALLRIHYILKTFEKSNDINKKLELPFGNYIFISGSPFSKFNKALTTKKAKKVSYTYIDLISYDKNMLLKHILGILKYDIKNSYLDKSFFKIYKLLDILKIALKETIKFKIEIEEQYLIIDSNFIFEEHLEFVQNLFISDKKIKMIMMNENNEELKGLSSGQNSFLIQIFSILDKIKFNTLILIDEPELYLHPTFEIIFMRFFRRILNEFNSYSIICTHSSIICRETPSSCVFVFRRTNENNIEIDTPSFETLSYDISEIINYVYDGVLEKTYYDEWLKKLIYEDRNLEINDFIEKYSGTFNSNILNKLLYLKESYAI